MDDNFCEFVADRLKEWGLEPLVEDFNRQKIDRETFLSIPEEGINQIIQLVGWSYTFLRKREEYLQNTMPKDELTYEKMKDDSTYENINNINGISTKSRRMKNKLRNELIKDTNNVTNESAGQALRKLLNSNLVGQHLLKKVNSLEASDRGDLVRIIIEHQMLITFTIAREKLLFWADQIVSIFPKEKRDTYYIPYKKDETVASGKLYDKYTNLKRKLISIHSSDKKSNEEELTALETTDIDKLKNVSIENYGEIKDLWIKTHSFRMVQLKKVDSISCYFELYPMLTNPIGSSLVILDFNHLNNFEEENVFMKIWPELSHKLITVAHKKLPCKNILKDLDADTTIEIQALVILPYLFRPTQAKSETRKKWTPTYKEQADSFILFIDHMNDLQRCLEDRVKQLRKHRNTSQPFIIAVGNPKKIDACYVIIATVKYKFQNIFVAVDLCFKSFFAFDLKYPVESKLVWIFIERKIYGINKNLPNPPAISSLLSDLELDIAEPSESEESFD